MTTDEDHAQMERSDALVMFGLTGDLGEKKLFPALAELVEGDRLRGPVIGVGRSAYSVDDLRAMFLEAVSDEQRPLVDQLDLRYVEGDSTDRATYELIAEALDGATCPVVYAALPPELFATVADLMHSSPLPDTARLVVEKPFGNSVASARELYDSIVSVIPSEQLFMVDHFLAKASVENLLAFRSANPMIEAAMRSGPVQRIECTMAEAFDVDGRGSFYDSVGAIKDVVQNHILQMLAVLLMEPPLDDSADAFDAARANLLGAMRPIDPGDVVLGQYAGYLDTEDVADTSETETFVACRMQIDNPRWDGVDLVVRTGKALASTYTETVIVFSDGSDDVPPNRLRLRLKPEQSTHVEFAVFDDEADSNLSPALLHSTPAPTPTLGDYASMLDEAMSGNQRPFARIDDTLAAWAVVAPMLAIDGPPETYEPGSMGPSSAGRLVPSGAWIEGANGHAPPADV